MIRSFRPAVACGCLLSRVDAMIACRYRWILCVSSAAHDARMPSGDKRMDITVDAVLAMAPDEASIKAARGLASSGKWQVLGCDDAAAWGLCQGSGSKPYQVRVDLSGPACACSCPSRKIPCKHALALLLLMAQNRDAFAEGDRPDWVCEWLEGRRQRAAKKEEGRARGKHTSPSSPRKESARLERMRAGLEELSRWMNDQVSQGLSSLSGRYEEWERMAARMVDAQMPGVAARIRDAASWVDRGEDWPAVVLARLGELQLLAEAYARMERLSPAEQADVRAALGYLPDKETVLSGDDRVTDMWKVIGVSEAEEDRLWRRRVWLYGRDSGRTALILDFSHGARLVEHVFLPGDDMRMTLAFYPGASPLRAVVADMPVSESAPEALPCRTLDEALADMAARVAANPWQSPLPLFFGGARLVRGEQAWQLLCDDDRVMPLVLDDADAWNILARSGGRTLVVCGEWNGSTLLPAGVFPQAS